MDEPTVGVDTENRKTLDQMLIRHLKHGGAAVIATHDDIGVDGDTLCLDGYTPEKHIDEYWS